MQNIQNQDGNKNRSINHFVKYDATFGENLGGLDWDCMIIAILMIFFVKNNNKKVNRIEKNQLHSFSSYNVKCNFE